MRLAWGAKVSTEFARREIALCMEIGIPDPSWLMGAMAFETGRTFAPDKLNPVSGATGLVQFMPTTAAGLGTTTYALARLSAEDQLSQYVRQYFLPFKGRLKTLEDVYMAILWPKAVGEANDFVLFGDGSKAYLQNKGLDVNADGSITKAEAAAYVQRLVDEGLRQENASETDVPTEQEPDVQPQQGKPMDPLTLIGIFGPVLAQLIPQLASFFKPETEVAKRNVGLVTTVLNTITSAAGTDSIEKAVAAMQADPNLKATVQQAVITHPDVIGLMEIGAGGIAGARSFSIQSQNAEKPFFYNPAFIISLLILLMPFLLVVDFLFVHPWAYEESSRTQIVTGVLAVILTVSGFWLGSTMSSQRKTEIAADQASASAGK